MDRKSLCSRSRRTTIMPVRMKVASSIKKQPVPLKPGFKHPNKENEYQGVRRNLMVSSYISSSKPGKPSKGYCSSTIQRRLSFNKNDSEVPDKSPPNYSRHQGNTSISSNASSEDRMPDESMLYPMSTSMSVRSPFSSNFAIRTVQKAGYVSVTSPFKLSENSFFKSASSTPKVALSDKTKALLKKMGIINPDGSVAEQKAPPKSAQKTRLLESARDTHLLESAQDTHLISSAQDTHLVRSAQKTESPPITVKQVVKSSLFHKDTQTSPHLCMDMKSSSGRYEMSIPKGNGILELITKMKNRSSQHAKEIEELISRQKKEMEDLYTNLLELFERGESLATVKSEPLLENCVGKMKVGTFQSASGIVSVAATDAQEVVLPSAVITEGPLISPVQKHCSAGDNSSFVVAANSQDDVKHPSEDGEIEPIDIDSAPLSQDVVNTVSVAKISQIATTVVADFPGELAQDPESQISKVRITPTLQTWRKHEFSFLETPRSGKWLVTNASDDDLSFGNTPTLGLNSMLKGMTIAGQPRELMETPATRRLVTKRILKGVESLFY